MNTTIEERMASLGLALPERCKPRGDFLPFVREGSLVFMAGQICEWNGEVPFQGPVASSHDERSGISLEQAQQAARLCALNLLFHLKSATDGDLGRVRRVVRVGGFVNGQSGFDRSPQVLNGASSVFIDLFGDAGRHARTAVGVSGLPANASVEVDAIFSIQTN